MPRFAPLLLVLTLAAAPTFAQGPAAPAVGDQAPAVELPGLVGEATDLADLFAEGRTVLVVLRGYPEYQCPACSRQTQSFQRQAAKFREAGVKVVLVYPGASPNLAQRAEEFLRGAELPEPLTVLLDPDYKLVNAYGIRWDAPRETAYPSTFVIAQGGEVEWVKVSTSHGGRADAKTVLQAL